MVYELLKKALSILDERFQNRCATRTIAVNEDRQRKERIKAKENVPKGIVANLPPIQNTENMINRRKNDGIQRTRCPGALLFMNHFRVKA
jgi:hypothetical protein